MNAERLHAIADALREELDKGSPAALSELVQALQQIVGDPSNAAHQQAASDARRRLTDLLTSAPSNDFSPAWRQDLEEIGSEALLGEGLLEDVEAILARNEITPSAAADELAPLSEALQQLDAGVNELRSGLERFNIGAEVLEPGTFEVGFQIPRLAVDNDLNSLGAEFQDLNALMGPFLEISTGSRPQIEVRSIASSEFQVLLDSLPATALLVATAVERVISSYEKIMNIRTASQQLKESGASQETLDSAAADAEATMDRDLDELAGELAQQAKDEERAHELKLELRRSLNALANRIDAGYGVEVRAGRLPEPSVEEDDEGNQTTTDEFAEIRNIALAVIEKQRELEYMNLTGSPILQLPEKSGEDEGQTEV